MRKIHFVLLVVLISAYNFGCSDGNISNSSNDKSPDLTPQTSIAVTKAALIGAIWNLSSNPDPDALCLINSTLTFDKTNSFMIMKNPYHDDYNSTPAAIVTSLNIKLATSNGAKDNDQCNTGSLQYIVSASKTSPIDIDSAENIASKQNLGAKAGSTPTDYPSTCKITAHFEREGSASVTENGKPAVGPANSDNSTVEQNSDSKTENDVEAESDSKKEETENADDTTSNDNDNDNTTNETTNQDAAYSIKLIVDSYDCSQSYGGYSPQNGVGYTAGSNGNSGYASGINGTETQPNQISGAQSR